MKTFPEGFEQTLCLSPKYSKKAAQTSENALFSGLYAQPVPDLALIRIKSIHPRRQKATLPDRGKKTGYPDVQGNSYMMQRIIFPPNAFLTGRGQNGKLCFFS
jgi:hypothetical protein